MLKYSRLILERNVSVKNLALLDKCGNNAVAVSTVPLCSRDAASRAFLGAAAQLVYLYTRKENA